MSTIDEEIAILNEELNHAKDIKAQNRIKKLIDMRMKQAAKKEFAWCRFNALEDEIELLERNGDPQGRIRSLMKERIKIGRTL